MAKWVLAEDPNAAQESDDSDAELADETDQTLETLQNSLLQPSPEIAGPSSSAPRKITIKLAGGSKSADRCHVCGKSGHFAGFVGAKYIDCINKPCYMCGHTGHSTTTCPFRISPGHGCAQDKAISTNSIASQLQQREVRANGVPCCPPPQLGEYAIDAAVLKLHARRTTALEFPKQHPSLVLSGDKKGQIAVWDIDKVFERTIYSSINRYMTNALRSMPGNDSLCSTASYDGTVKIFDIEVGNVISTLYEANPEGWEGTVDESKWITMMTCDVIPKGGSGIIVAGDSIGRIFLLDPRVPLSSEPAAMLRPHKKNTKVQCVHVNPVEENLILTAGNDYHARVLDIRCINAASNLDGANNDNQRAEVLSLVHTKVINAAYFSPITGRKIMTTCQDNRVRIWDNWTISVDENNEPSRAIVHSHSFNRYLSPFRAEWDPKDLTERIAVIGRYISEDFGGVALHPIDVIDVATGGLLAELVDPNLTTISPVNKPHPTRDIIVSGSSRSLYAWRPVKDDAVEEDHVVGEREQPERGVGGGSLLIDKIRRGLDEDGAAAGGSKWAGAAGPSTQKGAPKGSASFVFFDAEDTDGKKKGGGKRKTSTGGVEEDVGTKNKKGKTPSSKDEEEDSDED